MTVSLNPLNNNYGIQPLGGMLVVKFMPNSPAQKKAGLPFMKLLHSNGTTMILGDSITKVNGQVVRQVENLLSASYLRKGTR